MFLIKKNSPNENGPLNTNPLYYYISPNSSFNSSNSLVTYDNHQDNLKILKLIIYFLFCFLIIFLVYDFFILYKNVERDSSIEKNRCLEEYSSNKCEQMGIDDGPIINDYCTEKLKCISENNVLYHVVLIKYVKSISSNIYKGSNIINSIIISIIILIILNFLFRKNNSSYS
jgi:hypothetical protein